MPKHIEFTHQAFAAYSARNFDYALSLLCKALYYWQPTNQALSNASYNALYDAVEIAENLSIHLAVWETNAYTTEVIQGLKYSLDHLKEVNWTEFNQEVEQFKNLLKGVQIGFDFFNNNQLSLLEQQPILSFSLTKEGAITLLKGEESPRAAALIDAFNACFRLEMTSLEQCQKEVQKALNSKDIRSAQTLLEFMMEQYPESKKQAFLQLGHLHYQEKDYQKATEAYMKTIVMGTPKELVRENIQIACNSLARAAESSKEAARWREVLINFF